MAVPGLVLAYRNNSYWRISLYVPLIVWWTLLQPLAWRWDGNPVYFIGAGALLLVVAESHARGSRLAIPYRAYGVLLFGGALLPISYWQFNEWTWSADSPSSVIGMTAAILTLSVGIFGIAEWLRYRHLERGDMDAGPPN